MDDTEKIKKQAKEIMDNFVEKLGEVPIQENFENKQKEWFREEGEGKLGDNGFISRFLSNAPKISGSSVLTEKGSWVKNE